MEETKCPGCGITNDFKEIESVGSYKILKCKYCELVFSNPMKNPGGAWYDKTYVVRHSAIDDRVRDYYKWTINSIPNKGKLLDVGCGEGVFVNFARKKGYECYGIDFSEDAINLGKTIFGLDQLYNLSLEELKQLKGTSSYDVITFFEVLEHVDSPKEFIHELKPLLRKGGYVAASVPYIDRWPVREFNDFPPHHLTRWSKESLKTFLETNGFEVIQLSTGSKLGSYHNFLTNLIRLLMYRAFGLYGKGLKPSDRGTKILAKPTVKVVLSKLKPRQLRDLVLWPVALATFPFTSRWFKGYNLMVIAKVKS